MRFFNLICSFCVLILLFPSLILILILLYLLICSEIYLWRVLNIFHVNPYLEYNFSFEVLLSSINNSQRKDNKLYLVDLWEYPKRR